MQTQLPRFEERSVAPARAPDVTRDSATALTALLSILAFLLLNPFLAVFLLALVSVFRPVPLLSFAIPAALAFTLIFFFRNYGVEWYAESTDDVPQYILIYQTNYGLGFFDIVRRFFVFPNGNELLWQIPFWALINVFDATPDTFVFIQYLLVFATVIAAIGTLSRRHLPSLLLVYLLLIPISIESLSFIWRQQMAFAMFLSGVGLYMVKRNRIGFWLIVLSPMMHLANTFFVTMFFVAEYLRRHRAFENKLLVSAILVSVLVIVPVMSSMLIGFLESVGLGRVMDYVLLSSGLDETRVYLLMGVYALPQIGAFFLLRNDSVNNLFMVICLTVFSIVLALPTANGIYDRLLMFSLPLLSLYLYRCLMINFSAAWRVPVLILVFIIGVMRLHAPTDEGYGPGSYLAYGHAFDPTMGILRMLTDLQP